MVELKGKQLLVSTILTLIALGSLSYTSLPEAYCPLEDKTVRYVYMSESHKTVTKVVPSADEEGYSIVDDRCQSGYTIGEWIKVDGDNIKVLSECKPGIIAYTDEGKYYCDSDLNCVNEALNPRRLD